MLLLNVLQEFNKLLKNDKKKVQIIHWKWANNKLGSESGLKSA